MTRLMEEIRNENWSRALALATAGAEVNVRGQDGMTALMLAADTGRTDLMTALLDNGAEVNASSDYGGTALIYAACGRRHYAVRLLLERGADVHARSSFGTALTYAVCEGDTRSAGALIAHGARVSLNDKGMKMALYKAAERGWGDTIAFIERAAAEQDAVRAARISGGIPRALHIGPPLKLKKRGGPA